MYNRVEDGCTDNLINVQVTTYFGDTPRHIPEHVIGVAYLGLEQCRKQQPTETIDLVILVLEPIGPSDLKTVSPLAGNHANELDAEVGTDYQIWNIYVTTRLFKSFTETMNNEQLQQRTIEAKNDECLHSIRHMDDAQTKTAERIRGFLAWHKYGYGDVVLAFDGVRVSSASFPFDGRLTERLCARGNPSENYLNDNYDKRDKSSIKNFIKCTQQQQLLQNGFDDLITEDWQSNHFNDPRHRTNTELVTRGMMLKLTEDDRKDMIHNAKRKLYNSKDKKQINVSSIVVMLGSPSIDMKRLNQTIIQLLGESSDNQKWYPLSLLSRHTLCEYLHVSLVLQKQSKVPFTIVADLHESNVPWGGNVSPSDVYNCLRTAIVRLSTQGTPYPKGFESPRIGSKFALGSTMHVMNIMKATQHMCKHL